ncbi:MAG: hypothetical protein AAB217_19605 [Chloroflexota bacterium]
MTQTKPPNTTVKKAPKPRRAGLGPVGMVALGMMGLALIWLVWSQIQPTGQLPIFAPSPQETLVTQAAPHLPATVPSVWDSLLNQKLIIVSLAVAVVPLVGALGLKLLATMQQAWATTARQRQKQSPAGRQLGPQATEASVVLKTSTAGDEAKAEAVSRIPPQEAVSTPGSTQPAPPTTAPSVASQPAQPAQNTQAQAATSQPAAESQTPSAIQEILSSVFEDEASLTRYEVLLQELDDIPAADLLASCQTVAQQFNLLPGGGSKSLPGNRAKHQ